jgi:anaerobic magnesium-protoporphyrin IX monomethyl ester cyclase
LRVSFVAVGMEQLAIGQLAAILRRCGHDVALAFGRRLFDDRYFLSVPTLARWLDDDDVVEQLVRQRPDVVCFSSLTCTYRYMLDVAAQIKARTGAVTVFGGVHPSAVPETVLGEDAVDFVCVGEGDVALPYLLRELAAGRADRPMPNIAFRGPKGEVVRGRQLGFFQDLDALPYFEKDLWLEHLRLDDWYMTMSARGCPYRCTFCFNNFFANLGGPDRRKAGKYVRQRSVDHFIGELVEAKRRYGIRYVNIEDDIFTLDAAWLKEFARRYRKEVGVPFACLSHPQFVDEARVAALKEAGCVWVQMGIQSADEECRHSLKRNESQQRIERAIELFDQAGINLKTDHIFGLPGEAADAQARALELYTRSDLGRITTFWLCYTPGTEIVDHGLREGLITPEEVEETNRGFSTFFFRDRSIDDPAQRREYLLYEFVFRLLPVLPPALRRRVRPELFRPVNDGVLKTVGMTADLLGGLLRRNPDLRGYLSQYRIGLENHVRWRLGRAPRQRFGPPELGPVHDDRWNAAYAEMLRAFEVVPADVSASPAPAPAPFESALASAGK